MGQKTFSDDSYVLNRANHTGTQAASTISDFDTEVSNNTDVSANTSARHTHSNKILLDSLIDTGSGNQYLADDGTYKAISSGALTWNEVTTTAQTASVNNGYITNNASLVTITLPSTASVGDVVRVGGKGAGGWKIAQNASQTIHFGNTDTTTGTGGYLASSNQYDAIELLCITANSDWLVLSSVGNITVV